VFEALAARDAEAKAGITLLPGVGFDVVPPDCLTALLKRRLPLRRHGRIIAPPRPKAADCALVNGQQPTIVILWGDVSTAYYSTKIGNIEVRVAARGPCELRPSCQIVPRRIIGTSSCSSLLQAQVDRMPKGPSDEEVLRTATGSRSVLSPTPRANAHGRA